MESRLERAVRKRRLDVAAQIEAELATPPFPKALDYIWLAWSRMRRRKSGGFAGPNPIEWPDIDAFMRRTGTRLDPFDVELIEELDDLYLVTTAAQTAKADWQQALKDGLAAAGKGLKKVEQ